MTMRRANAKQRAFSHSLFITAWGFAILKQRGARIVWFIACCLICLAPASRVCAQDRIIDVEPYDEIILNAANGNAVIKTLPLEFKDRIVPSNPEPTSRLRLHLLSRPKRLYECEWTHIAKVRLYEYMVLEEAEKLTAKNDFNEAFDYYDFLLQNHPKLVGLQASIDTYLYKHALAETKAGRHESALVLLTELVDRNPNFSKLERAFEGVAERVINERVKQNRYEAARGAIALAQEKFSKTPLAKVENLREKMIGEAIALRTTAEQEFKAGQLRKAQLSSHKALVIWPDAEGVREFAQAMDQRYPVVTVGVMQPAGAATGRMIDDWPSRRIGRLLARQLVELTGFSPEGGIYRSPLGGLARDESGTRWSIQLRPEIPTDTGTPLTGYEVSRQLLALPDRFPRTQYDAWRDVFRGVAVKQVYGVQIELARPLLRPERLLETAEANPIPWPRNAKESSTPLYLRPYQLSTISEGTQFSLNRKYFAYDRKVPQEIIERHFLDSEDAIKALRLGEIDVLDRICPWDVGLLSGSESIAVNRYLLPTMHVLVPNPRKPAPSMAANRTLRRAMLYGINRELILDQSLLVGSAQEGSKVISGPFAASASINDPLGYGSDNGIQPIIYDTRMAMALFTIAMKELHPDGKTTVSAEKKDVPATPKQDAPIILAYPAEPIAKVACTTIVEHLKHVGIEVQLQEFDSQKSGPGDKYDFLYTELAAWEPAADARHLLGEQGLTGGCSPYMSLALAKLDQAVTWKEIRLRLGEIHRIATDELIVIPLWQTVDFYAYRRGVVDVGKKVVGLYQNVEQWKQPQPVVSR